MLTDASGIPLAYSLTGANEHDVTQLKPLVEAIPPIAGKVGRPRRRPRELYGDRAYDSQPHRDWLRQRNIQPKLARQNTEHGSGLGAFRYVVERTLGWQHHFRRLRLRWERYDWLHEAFMALSCVLICHRKLSPIPSSVRSSYWKRH